MQMGVVQTSGRLLSPPITHRPSLSAGYRWLSTHAKIKKASGEHERALARRWPVQTTPTTPTPGHGMGMPPPPQSAVVGPRPLEPAGGHGGRNPVYSKHPCTRKRALTLSVLELARATLGIAMHVMLHRGARCRRREACGFVKAPQVVDGRLVGLVSLCPRRARGGR